MFVSLLRKGFYLLCALMLFGFSSTNTEFISFGAFFIKYLPKPIIVNGRSKSIINIKIQNPIVNLLYYNSRFFRNSGSTSCSIIFNQFLSKTFLSSKDPLRSKYCFFNDSATTETYNYAINHTFLCSLPFPQDFFWRFDLIGDRMLCQF